MFTMSTCTHIITHYALSIMCIITLLPSIFCRLLNSPNTPPPFFLAGPPSLTDIRFLGENLRACEQNKRKKERERKSRGEERGKEKETREEWRKRRQRKGEINTILDTLHYMYMYTNTIWSHVQLNRCTCTTVVYQRERAYFLIVYHSFLKGHPP